MPLWIVNDPGVASSDVNETQGEQMKRFSMTAALAAAGIALTATIPARATDLNEIQTVVVIYLENWSFDALFARFPRAQGIAKSTPEQFTQLDRDGKTVLSGLPPVFGGMNAGVATGAPLAPVGLTQAQTAAYLGQFNHPYTYKALDQSNGDLVNNAPLEYTTRDLYHRFYENQMQINGGINNLFAAWADSGGLVMSYHDHVDGDLPLWNAAQKFVLADNFFQSAFGGSFLNHQYLICSCAPIYAPYTVPAGGTFPSPISYTIDGTV